MAQVTVSPCLLQTYAWWSSLPEPECSMDIRSPRCSHGSQYHPASRTHEAPPATSSWWWYSRWGPWWTNKGSKTVHPLPPNFYPPRSKEPQMTTYIYPHCWNTQTVHQPSRCGRLQDFSWDDPWCIGIQFSKTLKSDSERFILHIRLDCNPL